ncbi:MAG: NADase-type glycan-binding domain-containing protein, partial [Alphaproteobacteria bacterium]
MFRAALIAATLFVLAAPARAEACIDVPPGQTAPNATICVSSVLKAQGANTYGPENLRGDTDKAWCEGAPGDGQGEYVRIGWGQAIEFRSLV